MIKIVHLITGLNIGGAETMLSRLLSSMKRARFKNIVVSMIDEGVIGRRLRSDGIPLYALGMRRGVPNPMAIVKLIRILRSEDPLILQTWLHHADLLGFIAGRLTGVRAIAWNIRSSQADNQNTSKLFRSMLRLLSHLSPKPQAVVVNSEVGRLVHEKLSYRPRRWEVIPNGFDVDRFYPDSEARARVRSELGIAQDALVVGCVARFEPVKDHQTLLRAAHSLLREWPDVHLILVGRGVDISNPELAALVTELGLGRRVHLLGERSDVERIVPAFDIGSLSSSSEGFPNVVGEYMACGVPCVVTDVGDCARIVGNTGRVVPARNPVALAGAWNELIKMGPGFRRDLGMAARRRIEENYSLPAIVARYEGLYEEIAAGVRN
jgi:glycosyltransferase involved in cell wall biosynthesis